MTIEEIKELLAIFNDSGVAELELQRGENRLRIRRGGVNLDYTVSAAPAPAASSGGTAAAAPVAYPQAPTAPTPVPAKPAEADPNQILVKSPIVGTYYDAAAPGSAPFVRVGDPVEPGQVLCIIESMKLMNEIEAETSGTVAAKLVENGRPVEYGEALFAIRPR